MLTFHNDPNLKLKYVQRFEAHRKMDEVIQGTGFENGRGCFVGCTLNKYEYSAFETELGWPEWLAYIADSIFEGLPEEEAPQFGTDLLEAVPVGVDLEPVRWKLAIKRHERQLMMLKVNTEEYAEQVRQAIQQVIEYCEYQLAGTATEEQRKTTEFAAWTAAFAASESVFFAESARSAAWSARSSTWSVRSSTRAAARAAACIAVEYVHWQWERDTLLSLIRELQTGDR